jgi:hypothetical protein
MQDAAKRMTPMGSRGLAFAAGRFRRRADDARVTRQRRRPHECDLQQQQAGDNRRQHARKSATSRKWIHRRRLWFQNGG